MSSGLAVRAEPSVWFKGARPLTLGAGVVPVAVGAAASGHPSPWRTAAALVVAVGLQVGVNYLNDYFDGTRGVDTHRQGPVRLVASGLASPRSVATAATLSICVAGVAGTALAIAVQPLLILVGAAAILAAVLYSGGPRPYSALGLGELSVFIFFGLVPTLGTAYVQAGHVPVRAWWAAVPVGLLAVAILVVNDLRDIPTDSAAGKRTLAVRIGEGPCRALYAAALLGALAVVAVGSLDGALPPAAALAVAATPFAGMAMRIVATARGRELVAGLLATVRLHLVFGILLTVGLATS